MLTHRLGFPFDTPTRTVLSEVDSETLAVVEREIATSNLSVQDLAPLKSGPKQLMPDGHGGLLVLASDLGAVYRIPENYTLSNPLYLRLDPFYFNWPRPAPQMVLGTDVAYALVQDHPDASPYADDWGPPKVVAFDPVTLTPLLTTYLDQDAEQYLLHSVSASGAAIVTGPEWGNTQEVVPGVQASIEPAVALHAEAEQGVENTESPYSAGNPQGQHAIRTYGDIETAAISILREILPISNLLGREMGGEICTNDFGKYFGGPLHSGFRARSIRPSVLGFRRKPITIHILTRIGPWFHRSPARINPVGTMSPIGMLTGCSAISA